MRKDYLNIMETALNAYGEKRILEFLSKVRNEGLTEHGFPRLTANIGILIALGRRRDLLSTFIEMMNICCEQIPVKRAANDFSVKEICFALIVLKKEKAVDSCYIDRWEEQLRGFNPYLKYNIIAKSPCDPVGNWAAYNAASEYLRMVFCHVDSKDFVDLEIASQLLSFDKNGMYKDPGNPMLYDYATRCQMAIILFFGYDGQYKFKMNNFLRRAGDFSLKLQSVTGEIPFGGRSNQFLFNEAYQCAIFEFEANRYKKENNLEKACEFKAAANLSLNNIKHWINLEPISHVKNRYNIDSGLGCEDYAYFDKYMISLASFIYIAYLFADDSINRTNCPATKGGYLIETSDSFHKIILNSSGYYLEIDKKSDKNYDANGLGRVHKQGCPSAICLSVPFTVEPHYGIEKTNLQQMSICCFKETNNKIISGADSTTDYILIDYRATESNVTANFECKLIDNSIVYHTYNVTKRGVEVTALNSEISGFFIPVFEFDGKENTQIIVKQGNITIYYKDCYCKYLFDGTVEEKYEIMCNRNGRYRIYKVFTNSVHIVIEHC